MNDFQTTELLNLIERIKAGDVRATDLLIRRSTDSMKGIAERMLRGFPRVSERETIDDVIQNARTRLLSLLPKISPESVEAYVRIVAALIRNELLDMARYHGRHFRRTKGIKTSDESSGEELMAISPQDAINLNRWTAFHEAVGRLPEELRAVIELRFYESLTQMEIAQILKIDERTVRRRMDKIAQLLSEELGDDVPW